MNALIINQPNDIILGHAPEPTCGDGQALLRVRRVGYCGTDLNTFLGRNALVSYPRIPGHEIAATVERVGAGVDDSIRPGMDVTVLPYFACGDCPACRAHRPNACRGLRVSGVQCEGALTERIVVPADHLVHAPGLSLAEYALVEPLAIGAHAARRGRITQGDTVLVLGSGMIGLAAIAAASLVRGARVIAVDLDDRKLALAGQAGAAQTINSTTESLHDRVMELTGGDGPNVVIEAVGSPQTYVDAVELAAPAGRVVYIGHSKAPVTYDTKSIMLKELDMLGSRCATRADFEGVIQMLQSGRFPVEATITQTVSLPDAPQAMRDWSADPASVSKIQVSVIN